jgi:integrase
LTELDEPTGTQPCALPLHRPPDRRSAPTHADVDHQAGLVRAHREHAPLKTEAGRREVILAPALAKSLRERWLASRYKGPRDFVFLVSRQLGHANPTITLGVYAHLFERADHAAAARDALQASYATTVGPSV